MSDRPVHYAPPDGWLGKLGRHLHVIAGDPFTTHRAAVTCARCLYRLGHDDKAAS